MLVFTAGLLLLELVHSLQVAGSSDVVLVLTAGVLLVLEVHSLQVWLSLSEAVAVTSTGLLVVVLSRTGVLESTGSAEEDDSQGFQPSAETEPKKAAAAAIVVAFILFDLISEGFHEKIIFTLGKLLFSVCYS